MKLLKKYSLSQAIGWFADIQWCKRLGSCKHDACSGGHASPPLRLGGLHKFMAQAATTEMKLLKKYSLSQAIGWFADIQWRKRLGSCKHDACSGGHASPPLRLSGLQIFNGASGWVRANMTRVRVDMQVRP